MKAILLLLSAFSGLTFAAGSSSLPVGKPQQLTSPDQVPEGLEKSDWQSIHAAHEAWQHEFRAVECGWQAVNSGQQWTTTFDGRGFLAKPKDAEWTWGLAFQSYGFGERQTRIDGTPVVRAAGQRLTYQWSDGVEEWFVNDSRGIEHGFTLAERPAGSRENEALSLTLATRGALKPSLSADSQTVYFRDAGGAPLLNYSGLKVWDADGTVLPSRFQVVGSEVRLLVEESTARYPLTIDPIAQQAFLKASDIDPGYGGFGSSVAVSGDTVVVGAYRESSSTAGVNSTPNRKGFHSGAAYVFIRSGTAWSLQAYLKASNSANNDFFGTAVAVSGDTVVVGAPLEDSSTTGVNSTPNENAASSGAVYVFARSGTTWSQQAYLKASNTGASDNFGWSVTVSGDTVVVGARYEDSSTTGVNSVPDQSAYRSGAAYVFTRSGTTWSQQAYLKASNTGTGDFGTSVAISADTVVVGAPYEASSTTGVNSTPISGAAVSGAAYVFTRSGATWSQQAYLKASNTGVGDLFGSSVAVSGETLVVGAIGEDSSTTGVNSTPNDSAGDSGSAYVFTRSGSTWSQQAYLKASNTGAGDGFGTSVAIAGDTLVVGANGESSNTTGVNSTPNESAANSGAAYVFTRSGTAWSQQAYLKASNTGANDLFGTSVAVSGDTAVVGAELEDSNATGVNSTPNESGSDSGAAYIFSGLGPVIQPSEIAIQLAGTDIATNSTQASGARVVGTSSDLVFTILNTGPGTLALTGTPKVAVTGSSDFTVLIQPASPITGPSGSTTFTVRFAPSSIGTKNAVLYIPNNDADENPFIINLSGSGVTATTAFNNAISSNSSLTGSNALPSAIPFNDGVKNLLKYAFNMNLSGPDSRALVSGTGTSGLPAIGLTGTGASTTLRVEYLRRKGSGLVYTPKRSSTLAPGTFVAMSGSTVVTSIDNNWERVVVQESANPATLPKSFAIVEVSLP